MLFTLFHRNPPKKSQRKRSRSRICRIEELEGRELLSVTWNDFAAIKNDYADLNLTDYSDYTIYEIGGTDADSPFDFTAEGLQHAINAAVNTTNNTLIVVRTDTQDTLTLTGTELAININAADYGSVTIVGWGTARLTIDAQQQSRGFFVAAGSEVALAGLTITNGSTANNAYGSRHGGGIHNAGTLTVTYCTITENLVVSNGSGGGIYNSLFSSLTMSYSTIAGNSAQYDGGGGIYNNLYSTVNLTNCVIAGNSTTGSGGGIYNDSGTLNVTNCTIAGNSALSGAGLYNRGIGTITANNTIVATNSANYYADIYNTATLTGTHNLIGDGTGQSAFINAENGNFVGTTECLIDPVFVNMEGNDWKNWDLRLAAGSIAIDNGDDSLAVDGKGIPLAVDLDGKDRIIGGTVDMGAYEHGLRTPTIGEVIATSSSTIDITWNAVDNANAYVVEYATDAEFTILVGSVSVSTTWANLAGLDANTTYSIRIKATSAGGHGDSNWITTSATTLLATPTGFQSTGKTSNSVTLGWELVAGATDYEIRYRKVGEQWTEQNVIDAWTTISDLEPYTIYEFQVRATNVEGNYSDWSSIFVTTEKIQLAPLTLTEIIATGSSTLVVSWNTVDNADGYIVEYATDDSFTDVKTIVVAETSTTLTGLEAYTTYYVRVGAIGTGIYSDSGFSSTMSETTKKIQLDAPILGDVTATGSRTIDVTWSAVDNADGYIVEYATDQTVKTVFVTDTSTTLTGLEAYTTYSIRIRATGTGIYSDSEFSGTKSALTEKIQLTLPTLGDVIATSSSTIDVSWSAVDHASGYVVEYANDLIVKTVFVTETTTSLADLDAYTSYFIRVLAIGAEKYSDSEFSNTKSALTEKIQLGAPTLDEVIAASSSTIDVSWGAVDNANGYIIEYATDSSFMDAKTIFVAETSTTLTDLEAYTTYYVRTKATGAGIYSDSGFSSTKSALTEKIQLDAPALADAHATGSSSIVVSWNAVDNASGYEVEYATDDSFTDAKIILVADNSTTLTDLGAYTTYFIRIVTIGTGQYSDSEFSNMKSETTKKIQLDAPTFEDVIATGSSTLDVSWNVVDNASGYVVEYATDLIVKTVFITDTSIILADLEAYTTYSIWVRAIGTGIYSDSEFSGTKSALTEKIQLNAPAIDEVIASGSSTLDILWSAIPNTSGYIVEYATDDTFTDTKIVFVTETSATLTDLEASTTYHVRVRATGTDKYSDSEFSDVKSALTNKIQLDSPMLDDIIATGSSTIYVEWNAIDNASGYMVEYATDQIVKTVFVADTSTTLTDLEAYTIYHVSVRAIGTGQYSDSEVSYEKLVLTEKIQLDAPTLADVIATGSSTIYVTWITVDNADSYIIEYATGDSFTDAKTATTTATSITLIGLETYTIYYIRITAIGAGIYSDSKFSNMVSETTEKLQLDTPTLEVVIATSSNTIDVSWTAVDNANGYIVEYATDSSYKDAKTVSTINLSATLTGLTAYTTYFLRIKAIGTDIYYDSEFSGTKSGLTEKIQLPTPVFRNVSAVSNTITVTWNAVANANGYTIQYANNSSFTNVKTISVTTTTTTLTALTANTTYYVRIMATGVGTYSNSDAAVQSIKTKADNPVKPKVKVDKKATTLTTLSLALTTKTKDAGKNVEYIVSCTSHSMAPEQIAVTGNRVSVTGLNSGTKYRFSVVAKNADGVSAAAAFVTASTRKYAAVKGIKAKAGLDNIQLSWKASKVSETNGYIVEVYDTNGINRIETAEVAIASTNATITGLSAKTKYTFVVKAVASKVNQESITAKVKYSTKYVAVKKIQSRADLDSIELSWRASSTPKPAGITEVYEVAIYYDNHLIDTVNTTRTSAKIEGLSMATKYSFVVKAIAKNTATEQVFSESLSAKVSVSTAKYTAVKNVKVANKTDSTVTLTWNASKFIQTTGYEIVLLDNGIETPVEAVFTSATSATISGLDSSTTYTFLIRAVAIINDVNVKSLRAKITVKTRA